MYIECTMYMYMYMYALVAQLVEHWPGNPVVVGSNPIHDSSVFFHGLAWMFSFARIMCT